MLIETLVKLRKRWLPKNDEQKINNEAQRGVVGTGEPGAQSWGKAWSRVRQMFIIRHHLLVWL